MKTFVIIACCTFLFSCKNSNTAKNESKSDTATGNSTTEKAGKACFQLALNRDTFDLRYTRNNDTINGTMRFNYFEKDKSAGTIHGIFSGDTLKLFYDFQSEGKSSVRQIYFKQEEEQLIMGTGDEYTKGDSALLKDPLKVQFNGMIYKKTGCGKE
ncbi:hypothetical protein A8C56_14355 [Niabella ginsenosidivorans]|uniref:Lipoprotein n=1 Tax=Niabella ginsenosidivorans TaxID=1176587 RepID=A0A1A9I624_9BACT|nr:hypothetical protein [Niabella ginsenosidivorans]ANH81994.1 hypothetical protein A8C56_14355 [Niabella ginsenosidivorans]